MTPPELLPFDDLLSKLFALVVRPAESGALGRWDSSTLAARMTDLGVPTSPSYIRELRTGTRLTDPKRTTIWAIAAAFEVPVDFFFDPEAMESISAELSLRLDGLRGAGR